MSNERIVHDLIQSTPLWHKFRSEHHGASEAAAIAPMKSAASASARSASTTMKP